MRGALALAAVLGMGVAATAYATIPDRGGVIHGCFGKVGGVVRVIDPSQGGRCTPLEHALDWNQQGVKGDPGPPGAPGAAGISTAVHASNSGLVVLSHPPDQPTVVVSKQLPEGIWTIDATLQLFGIGTPGADDYASASCQLLESDAVHGGNAVIQSITDRRILSTLGQSQRSLALNGVLQLPAGGGDVSLACDDSADEQIQPGLANLVLLQVGSLS